MKRLKFSLFLLGLFSVAHAAETVAKLSFAEADAAFKERASAEKARAALVQFRKLHQAEPDSFETGWRVALGCYFVGLRLTPPGDERKALFAEGRDAGQRSLKAKSECAPCHFWTAINMALYGQEVGVFKMLFTLGEIRDHLREALRIDPAYASGGAQRLLGKIEEALPGILGGSDDRALDYYLKAVQIAQDEPLNALFLVKLLEKLDRPEVALAAAKKGAAIPVTDLSRLESLEAKEELQKWLKAKGHTPEPAVSASPSPAPSPAPDMTKRP